MISARSFSLVAAMVSLITRLQPVSALGNNVVTPGIPRSVAYMTDCWADCQCISGVLARPQCKLPAYGNGNDYFLQPPAYTAGALWWGNMDMPLMSKVANDVQLAQSQAWCGARGGFTLEDAHQHCFDIGAKASCEWGDCATTCTLHPSCYPSPAPTTKPTPSPSSATPTSAPTSKASCGEVCGDPHMKLFNGEYYDFHGQCDLVFVHAPGFAYGLGLDIHIRTKLRYGYSFVESAAVRIGDDVLEISSWGVYAMNGVTSADLAQAHLGPFTVAYTVESKKKSVFLIQNGDEGHIEVSTFKDWVNVKVFASEEHYGTSSGLMGEYPTGLMMARNGTTVFTKAEANEFGNEWQVTPDEPKLFVVEDREPQSKDGQKCIMPSATADQRRLGETIAEEAANEACAPYGKKVDLFEMCVFDVMASGDLEMAMSGVY